MCLSPSLEHLWDAVEIFICNQISTPIKFIELWTAIEAVLLNISPGEIHDMYLALLAYLCIFMFLLCSLTETCFQACMKGKTFQFNI